MIITVSKKKNKQINEYNSISEAIFKSKDRDTIHITSGIYNEKIYINKEINLIGIGKVIIRNDDDNLDNTIFVSEKSKLENLSVYSHEGDALHLYSCTDVILKDCKFISELGTSTTITGSFDFEFINCTINALETAIYYSNPFDMIGYFKDCYIESKQKYGIKSDKRGKLLITNTKIKSDLNCPICLKGDDTILNLKGCSLDFPNNFNNCLFINYALPSNLVIEN